MPQQIRSARTLKMGTFIEGPREDNLAKIPSILIAQKSIDSHVAMFRAQYNKPPPDRPVGLIVIKAATDFIWFHKKCFQFCVHQILGR
jgi:hypothetical protein